MKIAFGYKMGVGKDTACQYLRSKYKGQIIGFADTLYNILHHTLYIYILCNTIYYIINYMIPYELDCILHYI